MTRSQAAQQVSDNVFAMLVEHLTSADDAAGALLATAITELTRVHGPEEAAFCLQRIAASMMRSRLH